MRSKAEIRTTLAQFNQLVATHIVQAAAQPIHSAARQRALERAAHCAGTVQALRWMLGELERCELPPDDQF